MIVKIQRPISSTEDDPKALVYNRDRSFLIEMVMSDIEALFADGSVKVYHRVEQKGEQLLIHERVVDEDF